MSGLAHRSKPLGTAPNRGWLPVTVPVRHDASVLWKLAFTAASLGFGVLGLRLLLDESFRRRFPRSRFAEWSGPRTSSEALLKLCGLWYIVLTLIGIPFVWLLVDP